MKGEKTKVCCFFVHKHNNGIELEQMYLVDKGTELEDVSVGSSGCVKHSNACVCACVCVCVCACVCVCVCACVCVCVLFWISIVLKSFLVQSGGSRDRYSLGTHLNKDS